MALLKRTRKAEDTPPRPAQVCVDGQPATVIERTTDWVTVQHADGTTPSVRPDRITECTCNGGGCRG